MRRLADDPRLFRRVVPVDGLLKPQFDGVLQKFHEPFFLFGTSGLDRFALVTTERAQEQRLAAFAPEDMDAFAAHDFAAMGAFVCSGYARVPRANHSAVS
jgi:hypothetical protein